MRGALGVVRRFLGSIGLLRGFQSQIAGNAGLAAGFIRGLPRPAGRIQRGVARRLCPIGFARGEAGAFTGGFFRLAHAARHVGRDNPGVEPVAGRDVDEHPHRARNLVPRAHFLKGRAPEEFHTFPVQAQGGPAREASGRVQVASRFSTP